MTDPAYRPAPGPAYRMTRRRALGGLGAGALLMAGGPLGRAAATTGPPRIVLADPAEPLYLNRYLHDTRTIMQAIAFDDIAGAGYVVQVTQAGTTLPGDAPGDAEYAARVRNGDLTLTRLDRAGNRTGHMYLKGFGHGVSIGAQHHRGRAMLWAEVDAVTEGTTGWGTRLGRFAFADGAVLDGRGDDPRIEYRTLVPGADRTTANVDPVHHRLVMRYRVDGAFRFGVYRLADLDRTRRPQPVADVAQPAVLAGTTFQGYAVLGGFLYLLDGTIYGPANPPEGQGNTHLTCVDLRTGEVVERVRTTAGAELHRREPEGMAIHLPRPGDPATARLCFAFGTSVTADPAEDRLTSIFAVGPARIA